MPLDLSRLQPQIQEMAAHLAESRMDFGRRFESALALMFENGGDPALSALQERITSNRGRYTWLVADPTESLNARHSAPSTPADFVVLAVDGSQIEVERDAPVPCFLLNIGQVTLRYGPTPEARLENVPLLRFGDDDMVVRNPENRTREHAIDGAVLAAMRATAEVQALAALAETLPPNVPAIGLLDGTLVQWGLAGQEAYVQEKLLGDYLGALDVLERIAAQRPFAVASYISLPRATEAVNVLRIAACPYPVPDCDTHCKLATPLERGCDIVARVRDRDVFGRLLASGERSATFESRSSIMSRYGRHAVSFFYLQTGLEVARIEVPTWSRSRLELLHGLLWDQVHLGDGYPLALAEAHERAVVRAADRELFWQMVEAATSRGRIAPQASQKNAAKRRRRI